MASKRLVFFGTDAFSAPSLAALLDGGFEVVAVVTKPDAGIGRGRKLSVSPVKQLATDHGISVFQPVKLADIAPELAELKPDLGIVVAYGRILPPSVLQLFPLGLVNIHASLLPKYRGSSPIEAAILNGDAETGVTLMRIEPAMDTGALFAQKSLPLTGNETKPHLYEKLAELGAALLVRNLPQIQDGLLSPEPQDESKATMVNLINKDAGTVDWTKPAAAIERQVRAYLGWPGSRTRLCATEVIITAAHAGDSDPMPIGTGSIPGTPFRTSSGELAATTGRGELIIDRLKPASGREMTGREFLAGHPLPKSS